jgi:hypothetical protein
MLRALIHVGLSALLVIAPALCCCNVRLLAGQFTASPSACHDSPQPEPAVPTCCQIAKPEKASCCHEAEPAKANTPDQTNPSKPTAPKQPRCDFCSDRPDAQLPEIAPTLSAPEPTGELVPLAVLGLTALPPEHLGLLGGLESPERAGVDTRSAVLFTRHVLRC